MVYPSPLSILENGNMESVQYMVDSSEDEDDDDGFLDMSSLRGASLLGGESGVEISGPIIGTSATTITPPQPSMLPLPTAWKQPDLGVGPVFMRQRHRASSDISPASSSSMSPPLPPLSVHNFNYPRDPAREPGRKALPNLTINQDITKRFFSFFAASSWETLFSDVNKHYRDLVREKLRGKISFGDYMTDPKVQDGILYVRYHPTQAISDMIVAILLALTNSDMKVILEAAARLKRWLSDPEIYQKESQNAMYVYIARVMKGLVDELVAGGKDREGKKTELEKVMDLDERKNWGMALRNKMSLLTWKVEHSLRLKKDWEDEVAYPPAEEFEDVEWLLELTQLLREKRINGPSPNVVSEMEKDYIYQAVKLEPSNPFVKLGLLEVISDKKKGQSASSLSPEFDMSCRNLINRFPSSCHLRVQIAKFYLGRRRNRETAMEYMRHAIKCNPSHPEANLLAAKYLIDCRDASKVRLNFKTRETFYRIAMTSDPSNYVAAVEYFYHALGPSKAVTETMAVPSLFEDPSSTGGGADRGEVVLVTPVPEPTAVAAPGNLARPGNVYSTAMAALLSGYEERYTSALDTVVSAPYFLSWPDEAQLKMQFLQVLSFYASEEFGEALEYLLQIYKKNFVTSMIHSLDDYCQKYKWDLKLNFATFKLWLIREYDDILEMEREDKIELRQSQANAKNEVNALEENDDEASPTPAENESELSDDYEDMNDNPENDDDIKEMLAYLLQIL